MPILIFSILLSHCPGQRLALRLETVIACTLAFIYVFIKSRKLGRAILSALVVYLVSIAFYTLPYNIFHLWRLVWHKLPNATELYLGEGIIVRNPFLRLTYSIANNDLILLSLLLLLWSRRFAKNLFQRVFFSIFNITGLISVIYYLIGILFGFSVFYHSEKFSIKHPFDVVVPVTLLLAVLMISGLNHILKFERQNELTATQTNNISLLIFTALALSYAAVVGFGSFVVILVLISISLLRYLFPNQNKKLIFLDPLLQALLNLCFIFLGFSLFARENISKIFGANLIIALMTLLILQNYFIFIHKRSLKYILSLAWILGIFSFPWLLKSSMALTAILIITLITAGLILLMVVFTKLTRLSPVINFAFILILLIFFRNHIPSLTDAASGSPQAYAKYLLGDYFTISRERECANIQFEKAIKLGGREIQAVITAAYNYSLLGQLDEAIEKYRFAIEIDPSSIYAHSELARNLYLKGQLTEAYREFKKVIQLDPNNNQAKSFIAQLKYSISDTAFQKNELLSATQDEFRKNNLKKSIELAKSALALDTTLVAAYVLLARIYEKSAQFDSVMSYYQKAIRFDPKDTRYQYLDFLLTHNYWAQAIEELTALSQLVPDDTKILLNLGFVYLQINRADLAERQFRRVAEIDKKDQASRYNLGLFYSKQNRLDDAICYLKEVVLIAPNNLQARNLLGECYAKKGLINEAIREWETCLQFNPNYKSARDNLKQVKHP